LSGFFFGYIGCGVQLGPLCTAATDRPIVPAPGDYDDGEIGGMIGRGTRSTRRKPAPVPLCPPQTPHAARTRTRAAAVGSQRLTAWATARPNIVRLWNSVYESITDRLIHITFLATNGKLILKARGFSIVIPHYVTKALRGRQPPPPPRHRLSVHYICRLCY
jgi:hypothetical protein